MKWYTIPSVVISGLNSMLAAILLCLAAFHLYTDKSTNAPIVANEEWICLVTCLLPFCAVWMIISVVGIFTSMTRRKMILASSMVGLYTAVFGVSLYFTIAFGNQLEIEDVPSQTLLNVTMSQISKQQSKTWIPSWLDNVQKQSKQCCGIETYRDYEEFWPDFRTKFPRSCCRDSKELPTPCPGDLTQIPYPKTPGDYVKVDTGCMEEINEAARHHIRESYMNSIGMNVFIGLGVLAFLILYVKRYLVGESETEYRIRDKDFNASGGDYTSVLSAPTSSGDAPLIIASSNQIAATSLDSIEPNQLMASLDSIAVTEPAPSPGFYYSKDKDVPKEKENVPQIAISRAQPSMTKINKANAVFAGLQQQRPTEASTGDDMTIGGGNMGRYEVYLAPDSTDRPEHGRKTADKSQQDKLIPSPQLQQQRVLQTSTSGDDIGDVIHLDAEITSGSSPGSPGAGGSHGQLKKVRKLGLSHHHKNNKNDHHHHHHHSKE